MPHLGSMNTDISLRGPLLAAHRKLRNAVASRSAELKGECSAVAWQRREAGLDGGPGDGVLRPLLLSQALAAALAEFGGPGLIPQLTGFVDYLQAQQRKVGVACTVAAGDLNIIQEAHAPAAFNQPAYPAHPASHVPAVKASANVAARREFAQMFEESFGTLLLRHLDRK